MNNGIYLYFHCARCVQEKEPPNIEVGISKEGDLIVWCRNHDARVAYYDHATVGDTLVNIATAGCDCHSKEGN